MSGVHTVTRTITSAEIKALHATPIVLLAGRPGGSALPFVCSFRYRFGAVAYAGGANIVIGYSGTAALTLTTGVVTSAASNVGWAALGGIANWGADGVMINQPLLLSTTVAFTAGDGTLDVMVAYLDMPIGPAGVSGGTYRMFPAQPEEEAAAEAAKGGRGRK